MSNTMATNYLQLLPRDIVGIIKEINHPTLWLWIYKEYHYGRNVLYLIIEADTREDAIWKLKLAAGPCDNDCCIDNKKCGYGLHALFDPLGIRSPTTYLFDSYRFNHIKKDEFIKSFEYALDKYNNEKFFQYSLKKIDSFERI